MTKEFLRQLLDSGEGFTIEYKLCENKLSNSVYETVCSFSNRYGGYLLLGVEEIEKDGCKVGRVIGVNRPRRYRSSVDWGWWPAVPGSIKERPRSVTEDAKG